MYAYVRERENVKAIIGTAFQEYERLQCNACICNDAAAVAGEKEVEIGSTSNQTVTSLPGSLFSSHL